ncbi:hypothetical protein PS2015_1724 [Pseudohongiella spirulinae]|uniref:Uncharacterized protein n=1 Tax=Pseudohongiella spirulinae TaxID=1249552 RepID=A0A0S2KDI3_9GAMM|nr:hypothetical protein PS2015_1724 [Pseudohongiella spirulinae]
MTGGDAGDGGSALGTEAVYVPKRGDVDRLRPQRTTTVPRVTTTVPRVTTSPQPHS